MSDHLQSLGDFEKQVLLELDNVLDIREARPLIVGYERVLEIITINYDQCLSSTCCINDLLIEFNIKLCRCVPASA